MIFPPCSLKVKDMASSIPSHPHKGIIIEANVQRAKQKAKTKRVRFVSFHQSAMVCFLPTAKSLIPSTSFLACKGMNINISVHIISRLQFPIIKMVPVALEVLSSFGETKVQIVIAVWVKIGDQMARLESKGEASIFFRESLKTNKIIQSYHPLQPNKV